MPNTPKIASEEIRLAIIDALRDEHRRRMRRDDHQTRNYLILWGINAKTLYQDLADDLEYNELHYLNPESGADAKYQHLLFYEEIDGYPEVTVHIKMSRKGEPPVILVSVHSHNTGYAPMPMIPIQPDKND